MSRGLRWRIIVRQLRLVAILGFLAGVAFHAGRQAHDMIRDELASQRIVFPPAGSPALPASEYPDLQQYGGRQVLDGDTARAYAAFIGHHLRAVANGKTYAEVSSESLQHPEDQKLAAQALTLFRGETLRGLLLNAYGWWLVGQYAIDAALGLILAAAAVLAALAFELWRWALESRRRSRADTAPVTIAGAPAAGPSHQ